MTRRVRVRAILCVSVALALFFSSPPTQAALGKGYQILIDRGFQLQGLVTKDNGFHLQPEPHVPDDGGMTGGYLDIGYNTVNFLYASANNPNSNVGLLGAAPGIPWARWVDQQANMPPMGSESGYMSNLVGLSLADEQDLNNPAIRDAAVAWFNNATANPAYANTLLYTNSYGGQVNDANLIDFTSRAKPDMMSFDTYPFKSQYVAGGTGNPADYAPIPAYATITPFYSELRRYRDISRSYNIPFSAYMQTFSSVQNYDATVYRNPSPSELRLNNFAAVAFGAKQLVGFTYNTGASSFFVNDHHGGGDKVRTALYDEQKLVNKKLKNLGNTLVRLTPVNDWSTNGTTTNTLFIRGKHYDASSNTDVMDAIPANFTYNAGNPNSGFTTWQINKNDPYLRGWTITNLGTKNINPNTNAKLAGDVILSWFRVLDESFDGPASNEIYCMLVNGLSDPTGSAADCTQKIRLNYLSTMPGIQLMDSDTGLVQNIDVPIDPPTGRRLWEITLAGGDMALFKFNTGAPFVGVPEPNSAIAALGCLAFCAGRKRR